MTSVSRLSRAAFALALALAGRSAAQQAEPAGLRCLRQVYPEHVCAIAPNELALCDGRSLVYDDGRAKTPAQRLDDPDLEDMLAQPYDATLPLPPAAGSDPGRARPLALFDAMYGASEREVRAHLTEVVWLPSQGRRRLQVTTINGVHERLRAVSAALEQLPAALRAQAAQVAGSFKFRAIAGTERKSAHSYGIAIDVAPQLGDYWRWREPGLDPPVRYRNRMPLEIVRSFEGEGFIWGGRWSHYDTMHFEYRPELLAPECRAGPGAASLAPANPQPPAAVRAGGVAPGSAGQRASAAERGTGPAPGAANPQPSAAALGGGLAQAAPAVRYAWLSGPAQPSLRERIALPAGFQRIALPAGSFGAWLRELPLRPGRGVVHLYDGAPKPAQNLHAAVLDIDVGKRDLQQCADAVMRLRAEYLFASARADEICFRAASGDALPYASFRRGLRPPPGRGSPWTASAASDSSWRAFRSYLDRVFGIANTASLSRELTPVRDPSRIEPGDVYIEPARASRYGHAVLVLDAAEDARGERVFVIAQSYMPAQDIHILLEPEARSPSPWFRAPPDGSLRTPEWNFPPNSLKRFTTSCHP